MPTVLITGTSTGIGRVTAEVLAQRGWHVFATMRDVQKREKLEAALKTAGVQDRVEIVALDLTDRASIEAAVALVLSRTGGTLDAVVHNAGVSAAGAFDDVPFGIKVILVEPGPYRTQIWRSTPWIVPSGSPYRERVQLVSRAANEHAARSARDPREVAVAIARALEAKSPRFRYPVGPFARINHFLRGKVPSRLIRRGVSRYLGLNLNMKP